MPCRKPESVTLPGFHWRSEMGYAETPQVRENMIGHRCRVKIRPGLRVYRFRHTSTGPAANPGNPEGQDATPLTRCRPRGHNTSRRAEVWYQEHASRTTSARY